MKLEIQNLSVSIEGKEIVKGLSLTIQKGEMHALMGPNGSGKSTLANVLMGHPKYEVTSGKILLNNEDITEMPPDERARKGLFMSFQYPVEIPGVTVESFLKEAVKNVRKLEMVEFYTLLQETMKDFHMDPSFAKRYLNEGFSGGEKKRMEILQMLMLNPTFAVLDETDSGLDIDALKIVAEGINKMRDAGILIITHYNRILNYVKPDRVHVMIDGKIIKSGGRDLATEIEAQGYKVTA